MAEQIVVVNLGCDILHKIMQFLPEANQLYLRKVCKRTRAYVDELVGKFNPEGLVLEKEDICRYGKHFKFAHLALFLTDHDYNNVLDWALWGGDKKIIRYLINNKLIDPFYQYCVNEWSSFDLDLIDISTKMRGFYLACLFGRKQLVTYLHERVGLLSSHINMIMVLCCNNEDMISVIKLLIAHGADNFNWGLTRACKENQLEIAKLMLKHGANNIGKALILTKREHPNSVELINLLEQNLSKDRPLIDIASLNIESESESESEFDLGSDVENGLYDESIFE